jgi:plasmid stabilization system protein ParE
VTYTIHRQAEQDIEAAFHYYRHHAGDRIALRFLDEFERVAELITVNPGIGTRFGDNRRSYPLRVFPYAVIYRPADSGIRILVVRHQRREPGYGDERR